MASWVGATTLRAGAAALAVGGVGVAAVVGTEASAGTEARAGAAQPPRVAAPATGQHRAARPRHAFYFTRAVYNGYIKRGLVNGRIESTPSWAADYPKSDVQLLHLLNRILQIDAPSEANAVRLDDPDLRRFPFIYAVEVGLMELAPVEVENLRGYLESGGFLMVDDFWGSREWALFSRQMRRVFPDRPMVEIPTDHPIFHMVYQIDTVEQVPNLDNIRTGRTWEADGFVARVYGIFDDDGRLMVAVNWNTDLGDAWEWAENPDYPLKYSTYAAEIAANTIIYAMSH